MGYKRDGVRLRDEIYSDAECAIELINCPLLQGNGVGMGTTEQNTINYLCCIIELQVPTY